MVQEDIDMAGTELKDIDDVLSELVETDEEAGELVRQLDECRVAERRWAGTLADDMARLNDLRSLRRRLEREIRELLEARTPERRATADTDENRVARFPKSGDDT